MFYVDWIALDVCGKEIVALDDTGKNIRHLRFTRDLEEIEVKK